MSDEPWTGSKRQREALRAKYDGRCAYCGAIMDKMHADHLVPVLRVQTDPWGRRLPVGEQWKHRPERDVVSNMMPACGPCNLHKGGYSLEEWRALLNRADDVLARDKSIFRMAIRIGKIVINRNPVVFYFEHLSDEATK